MKDQFLRVHEVAMRVRKDVSSIRRAIAKGQLGYRRCGRIILVPESEVERILGKYQPPIVAQPVDSHYTSSSDKA